MPKESLMVVEGRTADMVGWVDEFARIEHEREEARAQLAAAERDMLSSAAGDPEAFATAKALREQATFALERLDWAEKAEHQRRAGAEHAEKMRQLEVAQQAAIAAHAHARTVKIELEILVTQVVNSVRALREDQNVIDRGVHFETFAVQAKDIPRGTLQSRIALDPEVAVALLRAARECGRLAQVADQVADQRAAQGKL